MFEGIPLSGLTSPALLGIAILMILSGRLYTKTAYDDKKEEADKWRLAYEAERTARQASDAQTAQLLELAKTTHAFMLAVFTHSKRVREDSGDFSDIPPAQE